MNNMNQSPSHYISIIIPAYNAEEYIKETIESVLAQTYKNTEIIVVDDGSTDDTYKIAIKFGSRIKLFKTKNSGVSSARNFAIAKAQGDWLAFIDADDLWAENKLEVQIEGLNNYRWSHTNSLYFGENQDGLTSRSDLSPQFGEWVFSNLLVDNFITTSTVIIEKNLFCQAGGFDESMKAMEDWKLWLTIAQQEKLHYCPKILAKYRVYAGSTSRKAREVLPLHVQLITEVFQTLSTKEKYKKLKNKAISQSYLTCSYIAEDSKDYTYSFHCSFKGLIYQPFVISNWKRLIRTMLNLI
jgi:glycosyltransferase involved in cell wall biosynthesis